MKRDRSLMISGAAERPRARLFCCAYAGGSASTFNEWHALLPRDVQLCALELPGHGARFSEMPLRSMQSVVDEAQSAVSSLLDVGFVLYGHSMGAVVALELAKRLSDAGKSPRALVVSACAAPHLPSRRSRRLFDMPRDELVPELVDLACFPQHLLALPSFIDTFLPTLRADFQCREEWQSEIRELQMPIHALGGSQDKLVTVQDLQEWQRHSQIRVNIRMFEGGHFFMKSNRDQVMAYLSRVLEEDAYD